MFYTLKIKKPPLKWLIIGFSLIVAVIIAILLFKPAQESVFSPQESWEHLLIDPGHGGIDGGAISLSGIKESNLNLSIGLKLKSLADLYGVKTVMTRSDDSMRTDTSSYSEHQELVYRTELANKTPGACLISIHQNFYPTSQPSGAQVLYGKSEGSRELGIITHNNIISKLQPDNRRVSMPAPKELYITSHINCPGILVECGFMSNFGDLQNLCNEDYQMKLAAVLLASYMQYKNALS